MSDRVRAGVVVSEALDFGWRRLPTVFRFIWAPLLIASLVSAGVMGLLVDAEVAASGEGPIAALRAPVPFVAMAIIGLGLLWLVLFSGVHAEIYRLVALGEDDRRIFNVRYDGVARRVFVAFLITGGISVGIGLLAALTSQAMTGVSVLDAARDFYRLAVWSEHAAGTEPPAELAGPVMRAAPMIALTALLAVGPSLYAATRLAAFPAGAAAENRLILRRAFDLTKGHAGAVLAALLLLSGALLALNIVIGLTVGIVDFAAQAFAGFGGPAALLAALLRAATGIAQFGFQLFAIGAQAAFGAIVYRRLATGA